MKRQLCKKSEAAAARIVDGEAVIVHLETGIYYSLEGSSAFAWAKIEAGAAVDEIAAALRLHYDVDADVIGSQLPGFIEQLRSEGLVVLDTSTQPVPDAPPAAARGRETFDPLELQRFDDLAETFALDPPLPDLAQAGTEEQGDV